MFYKLGGKPTDQIFELLRDKYGLQVGNVHDAATRKEQYFLELLHEAKPIEPVTEIAKRMHTTIPMAVASRGHRKYVELTLDAIGVRTLFDVVVCAEDYERGKPFPDPFLEAARQLDVAAEDCLVFEDSPLGVEAARAAGMECVFVPSKK